MRILKLIIISVIFFTVLALLFSLLIPSTVRISRAIDIHGRKEKLLPYVRDLSNWPAWNAYAKDSSGKFRIKMVSASDTLVLTNWKVGKQSIDNGLAVYSTKSGILTVQWYFDLHLKWYPWEKIGSITFDRQLGPVMEESLERLKRLVETNP